MNAIFIPCLAGVQTPAEAWSIVWVTVDFRSAAGTASCYAQRT